MTRSGLDGEVEATARSYSMKELVAEKSSYEVLNGAKKDVQAASYTNKILQGAYLLLRRYRRHILLTKPLK